MKKSVIFGLLIMLFTFGFSTCDNDNSDDDEFTVTFDLDGGNISGDTASVEITVKSGETVSSLPNPQKVNNSFDGWFTEKNGVGNEFKTSTEVTSNLTVYAKWTIINPYAGTWSNDVMAYIIDVDYNFVLKNDEQVEIAKGTVVVNSGTIAFTFNAIYIESEWKTDQSTLNKFADDSLDGSLTITGTISGSSSGSTITFTYFTLTKE